MELAKLKPRRVSCSDLIGNQVAQTKSPGVQNKRPPFSGIDGRKSPDATKGRSHRFWASGA